MPLQNTEDKNMGGRGSSLGGGNAATPRANTMVNSAQGFNDQMDRLNNQFRDGLITRQQWESNVQSLTQARNDTLSREEIELESRAREIRNMYNRGEIEQDTFGQLMINPTPERLRNAVSRGWITRAQYRSIMRGTRNR